MANKSNGVRDAILWLLIAAYAVDPILTDAFPGRLSSPLATPIAIVIPLLFALIHGARRYGAAKRQWRRKPGAKKSNAKSLATKSLATRSRGARSRRSIPRRCSKARGW